MTCSSVLPMYRRLGPDLETTSSGLARGASTEGAGSVSRVGTASTNRGMWRICSGPAGACGLADTTAGASSTLQMISSLHRFLQQPQGEDAAPPAMHLQRGSPQQDVGGHETHSDLCQPHPA